MAEAYLKILYEFCGVSLSEWAGTNPRSRFNSQRVRGHQHTHYQHEQNITKHEVDMCWEVDTIGDNIS